MGDSKTFDIPTKLREMEAANMGGADVAREFHDHTTRCAVILGGTLAQSDMSSEQLTNAREAFLADVAKHYDMGFNGMKGIRNEQR